MSAFEVIDVTTLETMLKAGGFRLVDVRTDEEVAGGIIAGAEHIVLNNLPAAVGTFSENDKIVFYCRSGNRSSQACAFMAARGYKQVINLTGGITAWLGAGKPVVQKG